MTTTVEELLARVEEAPDGPQVGAFFDYDGTVISGFSAAAFYRHRMRALEIGPVEITKTVLAARKGVGDEDDFARFLEMSLAAWADKPVDEMEELGRRLFTHDIASRLHTEAWELARAHRRKGHTIALASSALRFQVAPMAEELEADFALCTPVEVYDDPATGRTLLTGRVGGEPLWGRGKARAVRELAEEQDIDLSASFAYSNGGEDVPFLETTGHAVAVEPDHRLAALAETRGWPVLRCTPRGGTPGPIDIARTVAFYGSMAGALGLGVGASLANHGSRDTLLEITGGVGSDLGLALAGIDVDVVSGHEHLWSARPCLFVFNHQSKIDPIILMKLLRGGFTGVAKKEAQKVPGFGQFFQLAGVAFVERGNRGQWRKALEPAIAKVRDEGMSLVIAPEGTRSATPRLGRFKKGPFHIAMQAGVPMVPIVLRNAGEVMWRGAQTLRPGTVEVCVLPPVDTSGWAPETIDDHVEDVRERFVHTLAHFPSRERDHEKETTR